MQLEGIGRILKKCLYLMYWKPRVVLRKATEWYFDYRWGTDTTGFIVYSQDSTNPLHRTAEAYEATTPRNFKEIMRTVSNLPMPDVFLDIGCGKGRTLIMASLYGFKRVIGVEFDADLAKAAEANVSRFRKKMPDTRQLDIVCGDAGAYDFPDENSLIYFFNPFKECVMAKTLENIRRSARNTKERTIIYHIPMHAALMSDPAKFTLMIKTNTCSVYRMVF